MQPSDLSLCLKTIAKPEAADIHVTRRDRCAFQQMLGRLTEHAIEDVFLCASL